MPLSNSQYDEIMREYDQRQLQDRRILDERRKEVFQKIPKLKELESTVASRSVRQARLLLDGDTSALTALKEELADLSQQRDTLLSAGGFASNYLDPEMPLFQAGNHQYRVCTVQYSGNTEKREF